MVANVRKEGKESRRNITSFRWRRSRKRRENGGYKTTRYTSSRVADHMDELMVTAGGRGRISRTMKPKIIDEQIDR